LDCEGEPEGIDKEEWCRFAEKEKEKSASESGLLGCMADCSRLDWSVMKEFMGECLHAEGIEKETGCYQNKFGEYCPGEDGMLTRTGDGMRVDRPAEGTTFCDFNEPNCIKESVFKDASCTVLVLGPLYYPVPQDTSKCNLIGLTGRYGMTWVSDGQLVSASECVDDACSVDCREVYTVLLGQDSGCMGPYDVPGREYWIQLEGNITSESVGEDDAEKGEEGEESGAYEPSSELHSDRQQCAADGLWYACSDSNCASSRSCASNGGLLSCACDRPPSNCQDTAGFKDSKEYKCADWKSYNCDAYMGYSDSDMQNVRTNCPLSCKVCTPDPPEGEEKGPEEKAEEKGEWWEDWWQNTKGAWPHHGEEPWLQDGDGHDWSKEEKDQWRADSKADKTRDREWMRDAKKDARGNWRDARRERHQAGVVQDGDREPGESTVSEPCGCEQDGSFFCNFDDGESGFCEPCKHFDIVDDCSDDGLPESGVQDCVARCFTPGLIGAEAEAGLLDLDAAAVVAAAAATNSPAVEAVGSSSSSGIALPAILVSSAVLIVIGGLLLVVVTQRRQMMAVQTQLGAATDTQSVLVASSLNSEAAGDHVQRMLATGSHATAEI
jgi:hypothetical protein